MFAPGGRGVRVYRWRPTTTLSKAPHRPLPNPPSIWSFSKTPTFCPAVMDVCIMLKDISFSLPLAWGADLKRFLSLCSPLELQLIKAGIWDMKAGEFTCTPNHFTTPFVSGINGFIWRGGEWWPKKTKTALYWRIWRLLQAGCSPVKV